MPVPFEAILPMGLVVVMFGVTGTAFGLTRSLRNDGKPNRHDLDSWENMMMDRDKRLTGSHRGQSTNPSAPPEFSKNSIWSTERIRG